MFLNADSEWFTDGSVGGGEELKKLVTENFSCGYSLRGKELTLCLSSVNGEIL